MSLLFGDSFGTLNTATLGQKYDAVNGGQINTLPLGFGRTGTQWLQVTGGVFGPVKLFSNRTQLIAQLAAWNSGPGVGQSDSIVQFGVSGANYNISVRVDGDGSMALWRGPGDTAEVQLAISTLRPFVWNTWNYIELTALFSATVGTLVLNVNGQQVISIGPLRTVRAAAQPFSNYVQLFGLSSQNTFIQDFAVLDWSTAPNTTPIAQAKVYALLPFANGAVQWTPGGVGAGTSFANVNQVPPSGDTAFNASSTIGQADQYQANTVGVPAVVSIAAIQHCMSAKVDSGARTIVSDVGGNLSAVTFGLTTSYVVYCTPYDTNPSTTNPWRLADFPVSSGPEVNA